MARRKAVAEPAQSETAGEKNGNSIETSVSSEPTKETGTTAALFGSPETPVAEKSVAQDLPQEETQVEQSEAIREEKLPEEFDLEDILRKQNIPFEKVKTRIKVDGKEEVIPFSEFKKRVQLQEHIDRAGQELGRQRRELQELRKGQEKEPQRISRVPEQSDLVQSEAPSNSDPYIEKLERRLAQLEAQTAGLNPVIYDVNRQKVAKELKADGFDDLMDYLPRMEVEISKVTDPALQEFYDTEVGAKALYHRLKNQDLNEQIKNKTPESPKQAQMEKPKPPIQKIDGGQNPTSISNLDDWDAKNRELRTKWIKTQDPRVFQELLKHRNALSM